MTWLDPESSVSVRASLYVSATKGENLKVSSQTAARTDIFCNRSDVTGGASVWPGAGKLARTSVRNKACTPGLVERW